MSVDVIDISHKISQAYNVPLSVEDGVFTTKIVFRHHQFGAQNGEHALAVLLLRPQCGARSTHRLLQRLIRRGVKRIDAGAILPLMT